MARSPQSNIRCDLCLPTGQENGGPAGAGRYLEKARELLQELYSTILLHGKGSLREEYRIQIRETMQTKNTAVALMAIFASLDGKTERKFDTWRLRIL